MVKTIAKNKPSRGRWYCSSYDCNMTTEYDDESLEHQWLHPEHGYQILCTHVPPCASLYDHKVKNGDPEPWAKD